MNAISEAWGYLPNYLSSHVLLSMSALLLGLLLSLPLAVLAARYRRFGGVVLTLAGIVQTIPSLALLALFYPLLLLLSEFTLETFGFSFRALGFLPALLALTLYSMLPVLRNTVTGLGNIERSVKMAARGVGMTPWQSLTLVELPLAAPVIMAGIRTAAVWVIGTATLATPVGQTSLGNYIFTGLQIENWVFVTFGVVAAAGLALVIDRLLALAESGLALRSRNRIVAAAIGLVVVVGASLYPMLAVPRHAVVIGAKNFEEQYILAALIRDRLSAAGIESRERDDLGSSVIFRALAAGDVDVYVDYTGTLWSNAMKRTDAPGRKAVQDGVAAYVMDKHGIRDLGALGFENAYALAMRKDKAEALGIKTLSDLAAHAAQLRIGGDFEIFSRPEWKAVMDAYGLRFAVRRQYQPNLMYSALMSGDVDVITAFSSDGRIAEYGLTLLTDPKGALPPYDAIMLVSPAHAHDTAFLNALKPLIGAIDLKTMQRANLMVDRPDNKLSPTQAARWLEQTLAH
ncbi:MAG: ABC transporter permease/substrate-binding protein [Proteobacteria bacterium]|nr:ABC transporter permease/substrate-binding protein [Pseudomonadota bacterium]